MDQTEGHHKREISESGASHGRGEAGRASEQRVNLFELRVVSNVVSNVVSDVLSNVVSDVLSDVLSNVVSDVVSDVLSDVVSDVLSKGEREKGYFERSWGCIK